MSDLPRGFLRAEAQWLEEPDEPREDTYDDYCEHMYEVWKDDEAETDNGNKWKLANMVIERMRTKSNRIARVWRASWQPVGMTLDKKFYLVRPINPGNYGRNFSHGYFEATAYDSNIDQIPIYQEVENGI